MSLQPESQGLMHIEIEFLSEDGFCILGEVLAESLGLCAAEWLASPPLDSEIISAFPEIFAELRKKRFQTRTL
jgi:hypothetical protein